MSVAQSAGGLQGLCQPMAVSVRGVFAHKTVHPVLVKTDDMRRVRSFVPLQRSQEHPLVNTDDLAVQTLRNASVRKRDTQESKNFACASVSAASAGELGFL